MVPRTIVFLVAHDQQLQPLWPGYPRYLQRAAVAFRQALRRQVLVQGFAVRAVENDLEKAALHSSVMP